ncbi:MAG: hypothetical protein ACTHMV_02565 [Chitinophagaceae bacterium]
MKKNIWQTEPEEHDFPAALDFLSLLYPDNIAAEITDRLKQVKTITKKAKDILRASQLPLLPKENIHVRQDLQKVKKGKKLSPVLLVRAEKLIIADGYHRACAIYYLSEDQEIPCRITDKIV